MTPLFILGQIWGLCAMALIVISFQCKKPARLCIIQVCACLFFVLHYLFLGLNGDPAAYDNLTEFDGKDLNLPDGPGTYHIQLYISCEGQNKVVLTKK